ncbi:hypothetical protein C8R45DRAFT_1083299 [Mycena sanguinolenta]|nr:hypothetical protein C8R45DRAFT_1083299 [Mycena sanguinolenta]
MPHQSTVTEIRLENLADSLASVVTVLNELNDAFSPPFVQPILNTVVSVLKLVQNIKQNIKQNKKECAQLLEYVHQVLYAIIKLHLKSAAVGSLSHAMTEHVGKFMKTLQKVYTYIQAQQDGNRIKQFFHYIEMNGLAKDCYAELDKAKKRFEVDTSASVFRDIRQMKMAAETKHKELLEFISAMSDTNTTTDSSSMHLGSNKLKNSSNSFSLLPSIPKIFYGRETELEDIIKVLGQEAPRIAILGAGGMGKTSLARAALHHPDTLIRFQQRFFVSAEPATTSIELAALIGLHIGLNPSQDLTKAVVQYFAKNSSSLLILDNLETVWEPIQSRSAVEEFLSLLTDVQHLGLIVTVRGAERPVKVRWTHPFLLPLQPLSDDAAQQTFMDITDGSHSVEDCQKLLSFTDNMPLAVDLLAHLVDIEGLEYVLARWETAKTSMLSAGHDRKSNLDASINLSLLSPRITSESKELLSLLAILPNGLSDAELVQSKLPISNILSCKATLLATSLAYQNSNKRLMVLMPIREYVQQFSPPSSCLVHSLRKRFYVLLKLYGEYSDGQLQSVINQIVSNLGNLQEVLQEGLHAGDPNLADTIYCSISLSCFYRVTGRGVAPPMDHIQHMLPGISNPQLEIHFLIEALKSYKYYHQTLQMKKWIVQGISHFEQIHDLLLESKFYHADFSASLQFLAKAQKLSSLSGDHAEECKILCSLAEHKIACGHYPIAQEYARESQRHSELSMDLYQSAIALQLQAQCFTLLGNYQRSMIQLHKARKFLEICGMSGGLAGHKIANELAEIHLLKSEYTQAQRIFSDAVEISDKNDVAYDDALLNLAYIDIQIGGAEASVRENLNIVAGRHKGESGVFTLDVWTLIEAQLDLREQEFDLAQRKFQECLRSWAQIASLALEQLADIKAWPAWKEHSKWSIIYLSFACTAKEKLAVYKALLFLGDVFIINADEDTAFSLYTVALEGFTYMDVHRNRAQCMLHLGDLAHKHGNTVAAIAHWKAARPLFEKSSQAKDIAQIESRLADVEKAHEEALTALTKLQAPTQSLNKIHSQEQHVKVVLS